MAESSQPPASPRFSAYAAGLRPPAIDRLMAEVLQRPDILSLGAGFTSNELLPVEAVAAAAARLAQSPPPPAYLQYGTNQGHPVLREAIGAHLASFPGERAESYGSERVVISNGSQQALYILAQVLCERGDRVLVEAPSYFVFLEALKGLGIEPVPMPMRADGQIDPEALAAFLEEEKCTGTLPGIKMLYLMGYYGNPHARCVEENVKRALGTLLRELPAPPVVVEDGAYRELFYEAPHPAPTALSLPEFEGLPVVYAGTLTKPFATGLRIGYTVHSSAALRDALLRVKAHQDFGSAHYNQCLLADILQSGALTAHLQKVRPAYAAKMAALEEGLRTAGLPALGWRWESPRGGLLLWAEGPPGFDTGLDSAFCRACVEAGVLYVPGELCQPPGGACNFVRLSTGALLVDGLHEAAARFGEAARACTPKATP